VVSFARLKEIKMRRLTSLALSGIFAFSLQAGAADAYKQNPPTLLQGGVAAGIVFYGATQLTSGIYGTKEFFRLERLLSRIDQLKAIETEIDNTYTQPSKLDRYAELTKTREDLLKKILNTREARLTPNPENRIKLRENVERVQKEVYHSGPKVAYGVLEIGVAAIIFFFPNVSSDAEINSEQTLDILSHESAENVSLALIRASDDFKVRAQMMDQ
jgi:hypothetical protein